MIPRPRHARHAGRDPVGTNVAILPIIGVMDKHYHVWLRAGVVFVLKAKRYKSRAHANKVAAEMREDPEDRMVRACEQCPTTTPSKRRAPRWATVARQVAAAVGADPAAVRAALAAALDAERQR